MKLRFAIAALLAMSGAWLATPADAQSWSAASTSSVQAGETSWIET